MTISLVAKYPDYETIHCRLRHSSNKIIRHVLDNVEGAKKIYFLKKKQ